ncbi:Putative ribonuclease H protein [Glycine soja]|nr:Putative ribonuclease H protein [Glycine soja]
MAVGANFYAYPSGVEEGDLSTHFERHCARLNHTKTAYCDFSVVQKVFSQQPRDVRWLYPTVGYVKLNTNESSAGNQGISGFGGVIQDSNACWVVGYAGPCAMTMNTIAELKAFYHGLEIACSRGIINLICESDSMISTGVSFTHPSAALVAKIQAFKVKDWKLIFQHTLREGNFVADNLAKKGAHLDQLSIMNVCPNALHNLCFADAIGVSTVRLH